MEAFESHSDSQTGRVLTNEAACTRQHPRIRRAKAASRYLLLLAGAVLCYGVATFPVAIAVGQQRVVGDLETWDTLFGSRRAEEVLRKPGPAWFEGPQYWRSNILFSDTINDRIYKYDKRTGSSVFRHASGGAAPSDLEWMAEPGSNGIVIDHTRPNTAYLCQHGAHAVSRLDLRTKEITPLAVHFKGSRLNGPNDLVLDRAGEYLYFTDPIYAYLRKNRFQDAAYVDLECSKHLGVKGVYRLPVNGSEADLQLLDGFRLQRPNGLALSPDGKQLFVGECCQGTHLGGCRQGTVRYHVYDLLPSGTLSHLREIVFELSGDSSKKGCADGFKVHAQSGLLIASCASGICLVRTRPTSASEPFEREVLAASERGADGQSQEQGAGAVGYVNTVKQNSHATSDAVVDSGDIMNLEMDGSGIGGGGGEKGVAAGDVSHPERVDADKLTDGGTASGEEAGAEGEVGVNRVEKEKGEKGGGGGDEGRDSASGRRLMVAEGGDEDEQDDNVKLGLVARLEFGAQHPVSNVLLAADGFLYVTAQDPSGAGLLLKIPLRQDIDAEAMRQPHDELR